MQKLLDSQFFYDLHRRKHSTCLIHVPKIPSSDFAESSRVAHVCAGEDPIRPWEESLVDVFFLGIEVDVCEALQFDMVEKLAARIRMQLAFASVAWRMEFSLFLGNRFLKHS